MIAATMLFDLLSHLPGYSAINLTTYYTDFLEAETLLS